MDPLNISRVDNISAAAVEDAEVAVSNDAEVVSSDKRQKHLTMRRRTRGNVERRSLGGSPRLEQLHKTDPDHDLLHAFCPTVALHRTRRELLQQDHLAFSSSVDPAEFTDKTLCAGTSSAAACIVFDEADASEWRGWVAIEGSSVLGIAVLQKSETTRSRVDRGGAEMARHNGGNVLPLQAGVHPPILHE